MRRTAPFLLALLLLSCNEHPVSPFAENLVAEAIDVETSAGANKVDILFMVDNSGSMCEEQANLRRNFNLFIDKIVEIGADFQIAIITTDMMNPEESGRFQNIPDGTPGASCMETVDISACPTPENGEEYPPLVLRSADARYQNADGSVNRDKLQRDFGCSATVGTAGNGFEMGLEAAKTALDLNLRSGYNSNFLRDEAFLGVIFVTDENDCSDRGALDKVNGYVCEWESELLVPAQEYIDFFASLKGGDKSRIIMGGIIAPDTGVRFESPQMVTPSCTSGNGEGYAGYRYKEVIDGFENRALANICDESFDSALDSLGLLFREALENKCLGSPPDNCTNDGDCGDISNCEDTPRGSGSNCTEGRCFCEHFTVQVEVKRPAADGEIANRECEALPNTDDIRCILVQGEAADFYIDYNATNCDSSNMAIEFTGYQPAINDQVVVRYPRSLTPSAPTPDETPDDETPEDGQ